MIYARLKRILDFMLALVGMIVTLPLCIFVAALIKLDSRGPVIFRQERMGKDQKPFILYKFRTMTVSAPKDCPTCMLKDSESYITRLGRFLRKSSIDEIPQLINILKGDMSFIGPRPVVLREQELIQERIQQGIYSIRPGISGWAQINGRDAVSVEDKVRLDREYIDRMSLRFDVLCFLRTIVYVIRREGVVEGGKNVLASREGNGVVAYLRGKAS